MGGPRDDDERFGYGARRGWRAPKGAGGPGRRRQRHRGPRPSPDAAEDRAAPGPGSTADRIARVAGLDPEDAADLAGHELPPPGAPAVLPAGLRALGELLRTARRASDAAQDRADQAAEHRSRDASRARNRVDRAEERESRQAAKAAHEQGERQRLTGELERAHARLSQTAAERDRLRELADGPRGDAAPRHDDAEIAGLLARVADLEAQLVDRAVALEELTDAVERADADREHLRGAARRLRRLALEAGSPDVDLVDPEDHGPLRVDDLPHVRTVLEAVELAAAHAEHLVYTERAFTTARTAPYDEPRKLLRDLVALDRVAAAWAVEGGVGRPIRDVALAEQLEWADDVSTTARNQNAREYRFSHEGRPLWAGPHVRVATGRGLQRTCRIYLALVKGTEPDLAGLPRGVYVGPVGRHLSDSTSG
ncbi:hypothetical protein [Patulibacter minatonensis]|uniref:hypothetical protein n=1 Tax=Patulibacter minatonensis TaxID=298163 RepID=UPI00047924F8|nr:hypothetical protein [Patulibacter minatonensis]